MSNAGMKDLLNNSFTLNLNEWYGKIQELNKYSKQSLATQFDSDFTRIENQCQRNHKLVGRDDCK